MKKYNIYCDESNHLPHSNQVMTLGYILCNTEAVRSINCDIRAIKEKHGLNRAYEIKWTKVSAGKLAFYEELIKYFFESEMQFRCIVADKTRLDHERFSQNHDDWYYKMYHLLLGKTLSEEDTYRVYLDIKDTCSSSKIAALKDVLNRSYYSFAEQMIQNIQHVHSHEINIVQMADLFIGAVGYCNNGFASSPAKMAIIRMLEAHAKHRLNTSTMKFAKKFNLFLWEAR